MAVANLPRPLNRGTSGYNTTQELPIDGATKLTATAQQILDTPEVFNTWLRQQPWYLETLKQWGQDPANPHLSIDQRYRIADAAKRAGVDTGGGKFGIDPQGNVEDTSTPTYAKIAMAGAGGLGAAGALGAFGAATGAGYVGADVAGTAAATQAGIPAIVGAGGAAAGTAAAAASSGSWLTKNAGSLIGLGVQTAGNIYAANKQADLTEAAARIQAEEFDKALAAEREENLYKHSQDQLHTNQYGAYLSRLDPYARSGQAASNRLSEFMGQPAEAQTPLGPPMAPPPQSVITTPPPAPEQVQNLSAVNSQLAAAAAKSRGGAPLDYASQGDANGMVLMRGPDGSTRLVPADKVPAAFAAGARRVA